MKTIKMSLIYGVLLFSMIGCSELESKLCSGNCLHKEAAMNNEIAQSNIEKSNKMKIADLENEPLVCTLSSAEQLERKEELQKEVFSQVKKIEEIDNGYILSFVYDERFLMKMTDYVITENNCCPFFTFEIKLHSKNDALLKITGSTKAKQMLEMVLPKMR